MRALSDKQEIGRYHTQHRFFYIWSLFTKRGTKTAKYVKNPEKLSVVTSFIDLLNHYLPIEFLSVTNYFTTSGL